jgi:protein SCO1/2
MDLLSRPRRRAVRQRRAVPGFVLALVALLGCGDAPRVTGVVERVDAEYGQVVLTQPGLEAVLPAGSTALAAPPGVVEAVAPGQVVEAVVARGASGPEIRSVRFVRWADESEGWIESAGRRVRAERAEPIALEDTAGRPVSLAGLAGRVVLLDFIYTSCPGPCPAQTHNMRIVQRGLSEAARSRVRLVSVTIDPETDDAEALAAYAARHGADLSGWSFLTGPVAEVEDTYARYGIGISEGEDGAMDHTLRSFVIDDRGYVVDQYRSDAFDPDAVVRRLEVLAAEAAERADASTPDDLAPGA